MTSIEIVYHVPMTIRVVRNVKDKGICMTLDAFIKSQSGIIIFVQCVSTEHEQEAIIEVLKNKFKAIAFQMVPQPFYYKVEYTSDNSYHRWQEVLHEVEKKAWGDALVREYSKKKE